MGLWQPNPGFQTEAYFCEADEVGCGGEAGPGKTQTIVGLALQRHKRSLVLRRTNKEARALLDDFEICLGYRPKVDQSDSFRVEDRKIKIGGCEHEDDKQKYKGVPYDLIAWDQVEDFPEAVYNFVNIWCRSADPEVRPQIFATLNPPTSPTGLWVMRRWGAWLDPHHPRPAKSGEIRWFLNINDEDTEVEGKGPHFVNGEELYARSRTFIRGRLDENIELLESGYKDHRANIPEKYKEAYHFGDFEASLADVPNQVCPTKWVRAAVNRHSPHPPVGIPMCAIGVDPSGGGRDSMVIALRHDGWYHPMEVVAGKDIPIERAGKFVAGLIVSHRRDSARVIIDMGGGYGGSIYEQLRENSIDVEAFRGAEKSVRRTSDGQNGFFNRRTEAWWRFREALDPSLPGGSPISLPDDPFLIADLTAPLIKEDRKVLQLEEKEKTIERLGRSTDRGDAVVMAWACGDRYLDRPPPKGYGYLNPRNRPKVILGRAKHNRRR